jgi:hypothetical protein
MKRCSAATQGRGRVRIREAGVARRVLLAGELPVQLEGRSVLRIRHQEREQILDRGRRLELVLRHAQLQAHQLQQVGRLVTLVELLPCFAESTRVDQLGDSAQLRRQRWGDARAVRRGLLRAFRDRARISCDHIDILARDSSRARAMAEFGGPGAGGL